MKNPTSHFMLNKQLTGTVDSLRKSDEDTRAEVVVRAVALLKVAVEGEQRGERLVLVSEDGGEREIIL